MEHKLILKAAKLIPSHKKTQSRGGYASCLVIEPEGILEQDHGFLFVVTEVVGDRLVSEEVVNLISRVVRNEYYKDLTREPVPSFESAIQRLNDELSNLSKDERSNWLGRLNCVIGILAKNELHFTQAGSAEVHLYQGGKGYQLFKGQAAVHRGPAAKTYGSLVSGPAGEGQKVLISTPALFQHFSTHELEGLITSASPNAAIKQIAESIKDSPAETRSAVVIFEVTSPARLTASELPEEPDEIHLGEAERKPLDVLQAAGAASLPVAKKLGNAAKETARSSGTLFKTKVLPAVKKGAKSGGQKINQFSKAVAPKIKSAASQVKGSTPLIKNVKMPSKVAGILSVIGSKMPAPIRKIWARIPKAVFVFIAIAIFLAMIFGGQRSAQENTNLTAAFNEAKSKTEQAQSKLIIGDKAAARELLLEAQKQNNVVLKARGLKSFEAKLAREAKDKDQPAYTYKPADLGEFISKSLDQAEDVVRVNGAPTDLTTSTTAANNLELLGEQLYFFDEQKNSIFRFNTKTKQVEKVLEPKDVGKFRGMSEFSDAGLLFMSDRSVYQLDTDLKQLNDQPINGGSWEKGSYIASFNDNAYVLVPEENALYLHTKTAGGFSAGSDYYVNEELKTAKDALIDQYVFVLTGSGIIRIQRGEKQPASLSGLLTPLKNPTKLATAFEADTMFIADNGNKRILMFESADNSTYSFIRQYRNDDFANVKGLAFDPAAGTLYVLTSSQIYDFKL